MDPLNGHTPARGKVLRLTPELALARAARAFLVEPAMRCTKCDSTFVKREPAFVHCRHCGKLARIANVPLDVQELYERRSGLRIAS
jgi:hypothetical protein